MEDNASLEAQQAYCQGYIDCLFLLCGMGIIEKDSVANDIFEQLNEEPNPPAMLGRME